MELDDLDRRLKLATLESSSGLRLSVLNLGATLHSLDVPTSRGPVNIALSYPELADYISDPYYMGATVGPLANRVGNARFQLDGESFELDANEEATGHCLHGGTLGLHRQLFDLNVDDGRIECRCELAHGYGGFPGNRSVSVLYQFLGDTTLAIDFTVRSDRNTVISLANHAYFNLGGSIDQYELRVHANAYTPVCDSNIPTGEIRPVSGTRFDLRSMHPLGGESFDHNFVLGKGSREPRLAVELRSPESGLQLNLHTTQAGLQLYTADHLGPPFRPRQGLCLEAQAFPDAPNQPGFPSTRLAAGDVYWQRTVYELQNPGQ